METLVYVLEGPKANRPTKVHGPGWSLAYFAAGFALVDLHRNREAKEAFDAAIRLSPRNSKYLSERAHIDALEHNWRASLDGFKNSLDAVEFTPWDTKIPETTRALRGMAYAQIELGDLDAARALHGRVLELDPANTMSRDELRYIADRSRQHIGGVAIQDGRAPANSAAPTADPRFSPETQAHALIAFWRDTCLKHYRNPTTLQAAMMGTPHTKNPPHTASFLKGEPGTVWDVSANVYSQRALVLLDNGVCEVRAQIASAAHVDAAFSRDVEALVDVGVTVRRLAEGEIPNHGGPLRKTVYRVESKADGKLWHFGAGTTDSTQASTQAVLVISPPGARLSNNPTSSRNSR